MIGDALRSRTDRCRAAEVAIGVHVLNRMLELGRLTGIRSLGEPLRDIGSVQTDYARQLRDLCTAAVEEDGADVIILAGAPLAGLARTIRGELPVPVVDGVSSAVRHAETLVRLEPGLARAGSFAPPPAKPNLGLPGPLEELLRRSSI